MLRRTPLFGALFHNAPTVYPFQKPFHDTPHDQDRTSHDVIHKAHNSSASWPAWMDHGADGTGHGIGLHRTHPLSRLRGNFKRGKQDVGRVFDMMIHGVWHKSGRKLYFSGGKPPNPSQHPFLTGEPCPIYGWKVTDASVIRQFNVPHVEKDKIRYRPYVALQERKILGDTYAVKSTGKSITTKKPRSEHAQKPLMKRLFFWQ
jgi:hypothetical protein